jgi:hypothetical protein
LGNPEVASMNLVDTVPGVGEEPNDENGLSNGDA